MFLFLFEQNISIAIVGKNEKFHILTDEENAHFIDAVETRGGPPTDPDDGSGAVGSNEPASIDDMIEEERAPRDPQVLVAMET